MAPSTDGKRCRLVVIPEAAVRRKQQGATGGGAAAQAAAGAAAGAGAAAVAVEAGQILALAHPRGGPRPAQYLLSPEGQLCELQAFRPSGHKYGSWFVEQRVVSDGRLYVASPMDPKLLLLAAFEQHGARYSPLEQILAAAANAPGADRHAHHGLMALRRCAGLDLGKICDVNDQLGDDMILYRMNEGKALQWLKQKVERAARALAALAAAREGQGSLGAGFAAGFNPNEQHSQVSAAASASSSASSAATAAANTTPASQQLREPTREQVRTAVEIVCDYLNDAWSKKLMEHCGLTEEEMKQAAEQAKKRNAWESAGGDDQDKAMELMASKRFKPEGGSGSGNSSGGGPSSSSSSGGGGNKAAATTTAAQKKLAAASKGVKSISSFFGKKK